MPSPLLNQKKIKVFSLDQAIKFLHTHFKNLGYGARKTFCEKNKKINYATLNTIINYKPTKGKKQPISIKKISEIFQALGYNCKLVRTAEFHISSETRKS